MKYCKNCGSDSHVYESRAKEGMIFRRRICKNCKRKWMTIEIDYWQYMREHQKEGDDHANLL